MKKRFAVIILALIILSVAFYAYYSRQFGRSSEEFFAMDTYNIVNLTGVGHKKIAEIIKNKVIDLDEYYLSRQSGNSVISKINGNQGGELDEDLCECLKTMLDVYNESGHRFDFTLGAVSDLWGFGKENKIPESADLEKALSLSGADKLSLDGHSLKFPEGLVIDFGSVGKGIALDRIRDEVLSNSRISKGVISLGGSVLTFGKDDFNIAVNSPFGNGTMAVLTLPSGCVSTSGTYERFFEKDGVRYHHILNPQTGYPVDSGLVSVTVISQSGLLSDALSTACLACGLKDGMALAVKYGCDAVFIDEDRNVYITDGVSDKIEITDKSYTLINEE